MFKNIQVNPFKAKITAERYRERRRLATPSPTPSPPPRPPATTAGNWFKSLDRLARKKTSKKDVKVDKESILTTEDESTRKNWSKSKTLHSPAKNLRFFGDTDQESDVNTKQPVSKSKSHPTHSTLRKTTSNSSTGLDDVDHSLTNKSYSLTNLKESPKSKFYKRNLHNISERRREMSVSENESNLGRGKPPISPYDRSRSHSSSKTLKGTDSRRKNERGSSSELRGSKQELSKHRRRTPANHSGESSTEGESSHQSHQSQRSVVYLHATTVGDIPDPARLNRSRDDVSSINSSNLQVRSTTKSFSIFAPWTPKHYTDQHDVHYAQRPRRPVKEKSSSTRNLTEDRPNLQKNKSYSQSTLTRKPQNQRLTSSSQTLNRKPEKRTSSVQGSTLTRKSVPRDKKSQSNEVLNRDTERDKISRSISIPKDSNKKAGWFKLSNKKKQENTRVR
ncbi:hypothetical protein O0L34_g10197 [Tuta absoluta]|nr:hypothetical protein O0L34_g10197 [Tuta absoluta]